VRHRVPSHFNWTLTRCFTDCVRTSDRVRGTVRSRKTEFKYRQSITSLYRILVVSGPWAYA